MRTNTAALSSKPSPIPVPRLLEPSESSSYLDYLFAGKAIFTLVFPDSRRRTYKVERASKSRDGKPLPYFVSVLIGPENNSSYLFQGTIFEKCRFFARKKVSATARRDSTAIWAFSSVFSHLVQEGTLPPGYEFWSSGYCMCCGRLLTTPESIAASIGPYCSTHPKSDPPIPWTNTRKGKKWTRKR